MLSTAGVRQIPLWEPHRQQHSPSTNHHLPPALQALPPEALHAWLWVLLHSRSWRMGFLRSLKSRGDWKQKLNFLVTELLEFVLELPLEVRYYTILKTLQYPQNQFYSKWDYVLAKEILAKASPQTSVHLFVESIRCFWVAILKRRWEDKHRKINWRGTCTALGLSAGVQYSKTSVTVNQEPEQLTLMMRNEQLSICKETATSLGLSKAVNTSHSLGDLLSYSKLPISFLEPPCSTKPDGITPSPLLPQAATWAHTSGVLCAESAFAKVCKTL